MKPRIVLSGAILRANVRAYAALGSPVAAVVKNDGYGWGAARLVREIDDVVDSYVVADEAEFWALRMRTRRPIRILDAVDPGSIARIGAHGGVPNVASRDGVVAAAAYAAASGQRMTVRIGIIDAAGWSGIVASDVGAFAHLCATHDIRVELWTHITSAARRDAAATAFAAAVAVFRDAAVDVVSTDIASTAWAATERCGDRVRIGAGLFGARLGGSVGVACAIRVDAPVMRWLAPGTVRWAGYGDVAVPMRRGVAVLRCGYGDGFPKELAGTDDILSVGMQYTTRLADNATGEQTLIDQTSDLDQIAQLVGFDPHELIVGLAQHA
jgi:alanine racemase